jgi:HSP20 family molecular chaperone IbpA
MSTLIRRDSWNVLPDVLDWLESPFMTLRPYLVQPIRVEDDVADGRYVVRAELAGFDPEKEIEVTAGAGFLTIRAERADKSEGKRHSEFRYGTFSRTLPLPAGADDEDVTASYRNGVLEVSMGLKAVRRPGTAQKIEITTGGAAR